MESGLGELAAHFENNGLLVGCHWSPFKFPKNHKKVKSANIKYMYSVSEFPEWAKNEEVKSSNPILKYDMDSEKTPVKGAMNLVLTNKGWEIWNALQFTPSSGIGW